MKKLLTLVAIATLLTSCSSTPVQTIENLKAAITGESNASAKYAQFAQKAGTDSLVQVSKMFEALSKAEAIHVANLVEALNEYGVADFVPVIEEVAVDTTTLLNLQAAIAGENAEISVMYPEFIKVAQTEKAEKAIKAFDWALQTEQTHTALLTETVNVLSADSVNLELISALVVCPKCGYTFDSKATDEVCKLCGVPAAEFIVF